MSVLNSYGIQVPDQRLGISPANQETLFPAFYRVDAPQMSGIKGTGLSGVKALVKVMGHSISVQSEPEHRDYSDVDGRNHRTRSLHHRPSTLSWPALVKPAILVRKLVIQRPLRSLDLLPLRPLHLGRHRRVRVRMRRSRQQDMPPPLLFRPATLAHTADVRIGPMAAPRT